MVETAEQLHARARERHGTLQRESSRARLRAGRARSGNEEFEAARSAAADPALAARIEHGLWRPAALLLSPSLRRRIFGDVGATPL